MDRERIAHGCLEQAKWSARLGSPMYESLLLRIADDVLAGGPCLAALEPHDPMRAPLRLLAAMHRMVLEGRLPEAAPYYPSAGGKVDVEALWPLFLAAVPRAELPSSIQTNEVGRACALLPGFVEVHRRTGLPLCLLEIGASAGLNLRWDRFPFLDVPSGLRVVERRGCDLDPIDPTLDASRAALLQFVWPDQTERLRLLADAIEIARRVPATVDRCDAAEWLRIHLAGPRPGAATVVFHSVLTPHLTAEAYGAIQRILEDAGRRAGDDAPLAWLSMEPGADQADVHLTVWPDGGRRLIARSTFHGRDVTLAA